jgi:hypothetical protein
MNRDTAFSGIVTYSMLWRSLQNSQIFPCIWTYRKLKYQSNTNRTSSVCKFHISCSLETITTCWYHQERGYSWFMWDCNSTEPSLPRRESDCHRKRFCRPSEIRRELTPNSLGKNLRDWFSNHPNSIFYSEYGTRCIAEVWWNIWEGREKSFHW